MTCDIIRNDIIIIWVVLCSWVQSSTAVVLLLICLALCWTKRGGGARIYYFRPPTLSTSLWWHTILILCPWWQTHACTDSRLEIYFENVQTQWVDCNTYLQIKLIDQYCDLNIINICIRSHWTRLFFFFF